MGTDSEVVVFGSPMAVGHVRPLMPLAARGDGLDIAAALVVGWPQYGHPRAGRARPRLRIT